MSWQHVLSKLLVVNLSLLSGTSLTSRFFQSEHQFRTLTNFRKWPIIFEDLWCLTAGPSTWSTSGKNAENPDCNMGGYEGLVTATWAVTSILVTAHVVTRVFRDCSPTSTKQRASLSNTINLQILSAIF